MNFAAALSLFTNLVLKHLSSLFGCHTDSSIRIYDTVSFSNLPTIILVQLLSQIIYHTYWESFSWNFSNRNGVNLQWIYPVSIFDSNIEEKNLMWLAGLRKNMKSCQFMSEKYSSFQKLKKLLILTAPTSIHIERFSGCVSDWIILNNDWPIQKFDLLTLIWGSLYYIQTLNLCIPRIV